MTEVFRVGGDLVQASVAHNVRRLIAEGSGDEDEEEADEEMRCALWYWPRAHHGPC